MKSIDDLRFNAIAGYARRPMAYVIGEELSYFESDNGKVLGMIVRDRSDGDFSGMVFGADAVHRFRWVTMTPFSSSLSETEAQLAVLLEEHSKLDGAVNHQGDEPKQAVDFFATSVAVEKLNPSFLELANSEGYSSAKSIIEPMMRWYEDPDGNFIEQFQTTGFDQRIWELYIFATLVESGFILDRSHAAPDFFGTSLKGTLAIEAVTVNPTQIGGKVVEPPLPKSNDEVEAYLKHYMPIKFGSALYSKLNKKYWEKGHLADVPLALAVADFSSLSSMIHTGSSLERYLYGFDYRVVGDAENGLRPEAHKIESHAWGDKSIPSGFFRLPGAENISAVISSRSGTISKFNRIGLKCGFGSRRVLMIREGQMIDDDPTATQALYFRAIVNSKSYRERWGDGMNVYHNPRAKVRMAADLLPLAAHHTCDDEGGWTSQVPRSNILGSVTKIFCPVDVDAVLSAAGKNAIRVWKQEE